jgi:LysM repeat protein
MLASMEAPDSTIAPPLEPVLTEVTGASRNVSARAISAPPIALTVCPYLIAESGDWRLAIPAREHRCSAVAPLAALALEKQARLCLTIDHERCATYVAARAARESLAGAPESASRAGRWALASTTPLIEDGGGVRGRVTGLLVDRRAWPAIPVVMLAVTLLALAISGARNDQPATALATATSPAAAFTGTPRPSAPAPTAAPTPIDTPASTPPPTPELTPAPTVGPSPTPAYRTTYRVRAGDTLGAIATKFKTSVSAIEKLNGITDPGHLKIGQVLKIP